MGGGCRFPVREDLACIVLKPVTFYLFGMYARYWRYATVQDLVAVTLATSVASMLMVLIVPVGRSLHLFEWFPRSVLVIDWLLALICVGGIRMSARVIGESMSKAQKPRGSGQQKRVLVVGAGEAGTMVLREALRNPQLGLEIVGFLDDESFELGKRIHGTRVLGRVERLEDVAQSHRVDEVVIAMPTAPGRVVRALAESCRKAGIASQTLRIFFAATRSSIARIALRAPTTSPAAQSL